MITDVFAKDIVTTIMLDSLIRLKAYMAGPGKTTKRHVFRTEMTLEPSERKDENYIGEKNFSFVPLDLDSPIDKLGMPLAVIQEARNMAGDWTKHFVFHIVFKSLSNVLSPEERKGQDHAKQLHKKKHGSNWKDSDTHLTLVIQHASLLQTMAVRTSSPEWSSKNDDDCFKQIKQLLHTVTKDSAELHAFMNKLHTVLFEDQGQVLGIRKQVLAKDQFVIRCEDISNAAPSLYAECGSAGVLEGFSHTNESDLLKWMSRDLDVGRRDFQMDKSGWAPAELLVCWVNTATATGSTTTPVDTMHDELKAVAFFLTVYHKTLQTWMICTSFMTDACQENTPLVEEIMKYLSNTANMYGAKTLYVMETADVKLEQEATTKFMGRKLYTELYPKYLSDSSLPSVAHVVFQKTL